MTSIREFFTYAVHLGAIHLDALEHVLDVAMAGVGDQRDRMQKVVNDHRLENIELKIALRAGETDRGRRAVDLDADHRHGFALRGIHLAGHDGRPGFVLRNDEFTQAATRTGGQPADVVGNLHQRRGQGFHRALGKDDFVVG